MQESGDAASFRPQSLYFSCQKSSQTLVSAQSFHKPYFRKIRAPIKIKSALPPPPKKKPPKKGEFYGHCFSCRKNAFFPGVHKIGAPISGPRIADTNFTDTRIFLIICCIPKPGSLQFGGEALFWTFCALLHPLRFAYLHLSSFALIRSLWRCFVPFCIRPHLERPCLGIADYGSWASVSRSVDVCIQKLFSCGPGDEMRALSGPMRANRFAKRAKKLPRVKKSPRGDFLARRGVFFEGVQPLVSEGVLQCMFEGVD